MEEGNPKLESQLLQLKLQFMRQWTTVFFPQAHRSVINILCGLRLSGKERFDKNTPGHCLREIKDIDDMLTELKNGKLVTIEQVKASKAEKKTEFISLDFNFFNIYHTLSTTILQEIRPKLEQFKKFKSGEIKKVCKNCGAEKTQSELSFLGLKCNCTNTNFVVVEPNKKQIQRLQFIKGVLDKRFMIKKRIIDQLQKKLSESNIRRKKKQQDKQTNEFEQFIKRHNLPPVAEDKAGHIDRIKAQNIYGRKPEFYFVRQLKKIMQLRSRSQRTNRSISPNFDYRS